MVPQWPSCHPGLRHGCAVQCSVLVDALIISWGLNSRMAKNQLLLGTYQHLSALCPFPSLPSETCMYSAKSSHILPHLFSYSAFILSMCRKLTPILDPSPQLTIVISYWISWLPLSPLVSSSLRIFTLSRDHRIKFRLSRAFQALTI